MWQTLIRTDPRITLAFWLAVIGASIAALARGPGPAMLTGRTLLVALAALAAWTVVEYLVHRFIFHMPVKGPVSQSIQAHVHGFHHADPGDRNSLLMPLFVSVTVGLPVFVGARALLGPDQGLVFFAAFACAYLRYDMMHFLIHARPALARRWFPAAYRAHLHHHRWPDGNFGVSSRLADRIAGSFSPAEARPGAERIGSRA